MIKRWLEKRKAERAAKALREKRATECDALNDWYGGDWFYSEKEGRYLDNMTTRSAAFEG